MTDLISQYAAPLDNWAALRHAKHWAAVLMSSVIVFSLIVALPLIMQAMRR